MPELNVTLSSASAHLLSSLFEESKRRGEADTRWMKSPESYLEVLVEFAFRRKKSEWESRDKYQSDKILGAAFRKLQNGIPLTSQESELIRRAQEALKASA